MARDLEYTKSLKKLKLLIDFHIETCMSNKIKNVVIVAGGLNTRMENLSVFPKILFPMITYGSILSYDIEKIEEIGAKPYLVINNKYYEMVKQYCERNKLTDRITIIQSFNSDGSANTLKSVSAFLPDTDTLLVWSDLIVNDFNMLKYFLTKCERKSPIDDHKANNIIITSFGQYRFNVEEEYVKKTFKGIKIEELEKPKSSDTFVVAGNVPGIYWYNIRPDFLKIGEDKHNYDYIEFLRDYYPDDIDIEILGGNITEFRDKESYIRYIVNAPKGSDIEKKTRFFNSLTLSRDGETLFKSCKNEEYKHLIKKEIAWYTKAKEIGFGGIPKIENCHVDDDPKKEDWIEMELLKDYKTLHSWSETMNLDELKTMVNDVIAKFKELHSLEIKPVEFLDVQEDYEEEFINKVLRRCDSISHMLINYDREDLENTLVKACNYLYHDKCKIGVMPNTTYSFIHGDPNGSNVMYNKETREVKLIDPRGYFGKTKMFGPKEYDFAKILYFISGYDDFNKYPKIWKVDEPKEILESWNIPNDLMYAPCWVMLGIIWISLAQYIGQDIMKANIAYDYGLRILKEQLDSDK